jgi:starvation-inducible DNA-binding protein
MATNVQDLPDHERRETQTKNSIATFGGKINQVISDALSLYLKTKNFHWHVSGPHFRDYHLMLDEQASEILDTIDPLAERSAARRSVRLGRRGACAPLRTTRPNTSHPPQCSPNS